MGFSRQEYWSGLPFPSLEELPNPGITRPVILDFALGPRYFKTCVCVYVCVCVCVCEGVSWWHFLFLLTWPPCPQGLHFYAPNIPVLFHLSKNTPYQRKISGNLEHLSLIFFYLVNLVVLSMGKENFQFNGWEMLFLQFNFSFWWSLIIESWIMDSSFFFCLYSRILLREAEG